jgi:hypothetical protein
MITKAVSRNASINRRMKSVKNAQNKPQHRTLEIPQVMLEMPLEVR